MADSLPLETDLTDLINLRLYFLNPTTRGSIKNPGLK
jgi:hypothetical protein